jgi:hypothetical protein
MVRAKMWHADKPPWILIGDGVDIASSHELLEAVWSPSTCGNDSDATIYEGEYARMERPKELMGRPHMEQLLLDY